VLCSLFNADYAQQEVETCNRRAAVHGYTWKKKNDASSPVLLCLQATQQRAVAALLRHHVISVWGACSVFNTDYAQPGGGNMQQEGSGSRKHIKTNIC
jgi:hypothetical protein